MSLKGLSNERPKEDLIARPSEWKSSDDGLPPVGTVCRYFADENSHRQGGIGLKTIVLSYPKEGYVCLDAPNPSGGSPFIISTSRAYFVACKTDKEETINRASDLLEPCVDYREELEILYDAGMLRLPKSS